MIVFWITLAVLVLDQATKEWVRAAFSLHESATIIPGFFDLTYIRNTGAAFGIFSDYNLLLAMMALIMLVLLLVFRKKIIPNGLLYNIMLGLLCGGIIGNLLDRVRLNYVTDFLDFHLFGWHWPAFNVADSAICVAVGLYVIASFIYAVPEETPASPSNETAA